EALKVARPHERALHTGRGHLEDVPLGQALHRVQVRLERAAHPRAVVQRDAAVSRGDVDTEPEHRPRPGAGPFQLDQLEPEGFEPGFEFSLERIPVHGSPAIKKWGYIPHFSGHRSVAACTW